MAYKTKKAKKHISYDVMIYDKKSRKGYGVPYSYRTNSKSDALKEKAKQKEQLLDIKEQAPKKYNSAKPRVLLFETTQVGNKLKSKLI